MLRGKSLANIAIIAKKQFHKSYAELSDLFQSKHNDYYQLSILINCFDKNNLKYEFYSWDEFEIKGNDSYELLVIPQEMFLSGKLPASEMLWEKMDKLRSSGTNILILHHPACEFIEKKFLDINFIDYFSSPVLKYNIVDKADNKLVTNIDNIISTGVKAQDEFTYFEKEDSNFVTIIEKIPAHRESGNPSKYICFGYQSHTSVSKTYFLDIHSVGSSKRLNRKLFEQIINNLCLEIFTNLNSDKLIEEIINSDIPETEKKALIDSRIGQGKFRNQLIDYWQGCSISNVKTVEILKASHIKPWSKSNNLERLDLYNGFLLLPNLDTLFDKGFISFDIKGNILISDLIPSKEYKIMGVKPEMKINLHRNHQSYLQYHRDNVYKK